MNRRLLLFGIILLLAGVFLAIAITPNPASLVSVTTESISVRPNGIIYTTIVLNSTNVPSIVYISQNAIDFYLVNSTAFASLAPNLTTGTFPTNFINETKGRGLIVAAENSSRGAFSYTGSSSLSQKNTSLPFYIFNQSLLLQPGTYYAIYRNPGSSPVNTTYRYILPNAGLLNSQSVLSSGGSDAGIVAALLLLSGIILIIYALLDRKKLKTQEGEREEEIARMYRRIEKKGKTSKAKRKKRRKRGR